MPPCCELIDHTTVPLEVPWQKSGTAAHPSWASADCSPFPRLASAALGASVDDRSALLVVSAPDADPERGPYNEWLARTILPTTPALRAGSSASGVGQLLRPQGDSNPCYSLERAVSWAGLDDGDV